MFRDTETLASSKLKDPWSASSFGGSLKAEVLDTLQARYPDLEQHVRLRILFAALALRRGPLAALAPQLRLLAQTAQDDEDEWVRVFGHAVADFSGPLNLQRVRDAVPAVEELINNLKEELSKVEVSEFRPMEDKYLSPHMLSSAPPSHPGQTHTHFRPRSHALDEHRAQMALRKVPSLSSSSLRDMASASTSSGPSPSSLGPSAAAAAATTTTSAGGGGASGSRDPLSQAPPSSGLKRPLSKGGDSEGDLARLQATYNLGRADKAKLVKRPSRMIVMEATEAISIQQQQEQAKEEKEAERRTQAREKPLPPTPPPPPSAGGGGERGGGSGQAGPGGVREVAGEAKRRREEDRALKAGKREKHLEHGLHKPRGTSSHNRRERESEGDGRRSGIGGDGRQPHSRSRLEDLEEEEDEEKAPRHLHHQHSSHHHHQQEEEEEEDGELPHGSDSFVASQWLGVNARAIPSRFTDLLPILCSAVWHGPRCARSQCEAHVIHFSLERFDEDWSAFVHVIS